MMMMMMMIRLKFKDETIIVLHLERSVMWR
jgi:hypothetical protein